MPWRNTPKGEKNEIPAAVSKSGDELTLELAKEISLAVERRAESLGKKWLLPFWIREQSLCFCTQ